MSKVYMHGIDISQWNGNIDLNQYRDQFVIVRAAYGRKPDPKAQRNMAECERLGIPYGVYVYSYALDAEAARMEADHVLQMLRGRKISVGVWFDMEDADGWKKNHGVTSPVIISAMCRAFCDKVKAAGYYCGIYASRSWFGTKIVGVPDYPKWVADWGANNGFVNTDTSHMGPLQQFTSKPLDRNVMYVPLSTFGANPEKKGIAVDGVWGPETTMATQRLLKTPVDGKVSRQPLHNKKYLPAAKGGWEFKALAFGHGSPMVRQLQKLVGANQDGFFGPKTATKLQSYLGIKVSGKLDTATVRAWQEHLNRKAK